jgi:putative transposase
LGFRESNKHGAMQRSYYAEVQAAYALRQAKSGWSVSDVCRSWVISVVTVYNCKKRYGYLGASEVRRRVALILIFWFSS